MKTIFKHTQAVDGRFEAERVPGRVPHEMITMKHHLKVSTNDGHLSVILQREHPESPVFSIEILMDDGLIPKVQLPGHDKPKTDTIDLFPLDVTVNGQPGAVMVGSQGKPTFFTNVGPVCSHCGGKTGCPGIGPCQFCGTVNDEDDTPYLAGGEGEGKNDVS